MTNVEALLLRVTLVISPSLFMTRTSSEVEEDSFLKEPLVVVTESENCFGVSDPVLDRVTIFLASENRLKIMYYKSRTYIITCITKTSWYCI